MKKFFLKFIKIITGVKTSKSGPGSDLSNTRKLEELPKIIKKYNINSIFDAPCGIFWIKSSG